jgi:hypothetical protein
MAHCPFERHDGKRYRPPIPPQAHRETKARCERQINLPKMRDGGGIGGQVLDAVLFGKPIFLVVVVRRLLV